MIIALIAVSYTDLDEVHVGTVYYVEVLCRVCLGFRFVVLSRVYTLDTMICYCTQKQVNVNVTCTYTCVCVYVVCGGIKAYLPFPLGLAKHSTRGPGSDLCWY